MRNLAAALFVLVALAFAHGTARAQYGYPPPPPGPPPGYGYGGYGGGYGPPPAPPPQGTYRDGLVFGGSLGLGHFSLTQDKRSGDLASEGGASFTLHVGYMFTPRFALMGELWVVATGDKNNPDASQDSTMAVIAARWFAGESLWVEAGIGGGGYSYSCDTCNRIQPQIAISEASDNQSGTAFELGVGIELWHNGNFALDVNGRAGFIAIGQNQNGDSILSTMLALNVGLNWY